MRPYVVLLIVSLGWSSLTGCSFFRDLHHKQTKAQEDYHDEFRQAGEEGRAEMPREKETDALTPWLQSPEARAIEKNLGIE